MPIDYVIISKKDSMYFEQFNPEEIIIIVFIYFLRWCQINIFY